MMYRTKYGTASGPMQTDCLPDSAGDWGLNYSNVIQVRCINSG